MAPHHVACLNVNRRERRWSKVAARSVDHIADANRVTEVNAHQPIRPHLLNGRLISGTAELQHATAATVSARHEKQVVRSPNRRAGVQAEVYRMSVTPQQIAVVWIDA